MRQVKTLSPRRIAGCFVVGIIRHYFSETALVHIYIPQTYTPWGCKAHTVLGSLISLSWASALPLLPFTLHIYYTTLLWFCQEVFENFSKNFFKTDCLHILCKSYCPPLDTYIIPQIYGFVKGFCKNNGKNFVRTLLLNRFPFHNLLTKAVVCPFDTYIIP